MTRPVPTTFARKTDRVRAAVSAARGAGRGHFEVTPEVELGVRLVVTEVGGQPLTFSLWSLPQDIAELCSDASVPATAALLAIDGDQARDAIAAGKTIDLAQFTRSQSNPNLYYALFDFVSPRQIHTVLHRLVPALEPHPAVA
ncbi:MAG: hypothetical protein WC709_03865 [Thermoleophilia bacterium]